MTALSNHNRQQLFDKFLSGGFLENQRPDSQNKLAERYRVNYQKWLPENKEAAILEIGFGLGAFLKYLEEEQYINYSGVEISREMYEYARQATDKIFLIDSLEDYLKDKKQQFDFIILNDVIEHQEKEKIIPLLKLFRASLKTSGRLIIKTNNAAALTGCRMRFEDFTHELAFTEYSLRQALRAAGFKKITIQPFIFPRNSWPRKLRALAQWLVNSCWRAVYWLQYTTVPRYVDEFIFAVAEI
ncbi:class I SAM-dependent methyltransferase [Patescibacteria group bacterium]|nr:class I SAM-dependent methyltransferase [Patescibacteria group bacterium]